MIKFDTRLLAGKSIDSLDDRYFRLDATTDEIKLTDFAQDKIAKAMKEFYGKKLKELSLQAGDLTYVTQSKSPKAVEDLEATAEVKAEYQAKYGKDAEKLREEVAKLEREYKDTHPDEFHVVYKIDSGSYLDENGKWTSSGGTLTELQCSNIHTAAAGYHTADAFMKNAVLDKDNMPKVAALEAKDRAAWSAKKQEILARLLSKPEYSHLPKDVLQPPKITKEEYTYTINASKTNSTTIDDELLVEAANEYVRTMLEK